MSPWDIGLRAQVLHTDRRIPHVQELLLARVLIVDDQPDFRRHLSRLLSRAGFENVDEADTIGAAVTSVAANCPDLALVDLMLPDVGGLEGTPRLKALCPSLRVIVISVLGNQCESLRAAAVAAGAEDFFPKDMLNLEVAKSWTA